MLLTVKFIFPFVVLNMAFESITTLELLAMLYHVIKYLLIEVVQTVLYI